MPKIPAPNPDGEPNITPEVQAVIEEVTPTGELGSQGNENVETLRRTAAASIGLDYDTMNPDEYGFLDAIQDQSLESLRRLDPNGDESLKPLALSDNPMIPGAAEPTEIPDPTPAPGVTPEPVVEGSEVGLGNLEAPEAGGGGPDASAHGEPSTTPSLVPELIDLGDGILITREEARARLEQANAGQQLTPDELQMIALRRQGLVGYQLIDPSTGLPVQQNAQPSPQQQPQAQPFGSADDWIDPQAHAAFMALRQQQEQGFSQILANQRAMAQADLERETNALQVIAEDTRNSFLTSRGLDPAAEADTFDKYLEQSGFLDVAARRFPGDPRSALTAAYGAVYGSTPKYQEHERERIIAMHTQQTQQVQEKKTAQQGIASSPGTVSRSTPAPKTQDERMAAAAALVENDPLWQSSR